MRPFVAMQKRPFVVPSEAFSESHLGSLAELSRALASPDSQFAPAHRMRAGQPGPQFGRQEPKAI